MANYPAENATLKLTHALYTTHSNLNTLYLHDSSTSFLHKAVVYKPAFIPLSNKG